MKAKEQKSIFEEFEDVEDIFDEFGDIEGRLFEINRDDNENKRLEKYVMM